MPRRSRPVLAAAVAAAAAVLTVVGLNPLRSASPQSGTVDRDHPEVSWSGAPVGQAGGISNRACIVGQPVADPTCDTFALTIGDLSAAAPPPPDAGTKKPKKKDPSPPPPVPAKDDVRIAIATTEAGLAEFDLYVFGPGDEEVGRSTKLGSNDVVLLREPDAGTYTVAVQNALSQTPGASYQAKAIAIDATDVPVDVEPTYCGFEGAPEVRDIDSSIVGAGALLGDPTASLDGLDLGQRISLDVLVLLDGVAQGDAEALFATAARSYEPLNIALTVVGYQPVDFATTDGVALIAKGKELLGGKRPEGVDIVEVLTARDIQQLGQPAVAGIADCLGGVAHDDRAFLVAEAYSGQNVTFPLVPVTFVYEARANVTAHEIGHLLNGRHENANCVEGVQPTDVHADDGFVEGSPCTLMFNVADFLGYNFSTVNATLVRGSAVRYAQP